MEYQDFFFQAAIYLLAAVLSVPLAKRFGFGSVLGYLIAGIVIGPHMLGVAGKEAADVMLFAEFGVVMMLFLIGLEMRPQLIWQLRSHILGMGALQVVLTILAFTVIFSLMGHEFNESLALGMIFAMSSTAIVMQMLTEKAWIHSPAGRSAFSVLLFQDIAVVPIMAIFPLLVLNDVINAPHELKFIHQLKDWQQVLVMLAVIGAVILAGRYLLRPIFRFIASSKLREIFTAASLLIVIGNALLMEAIGLSAALGTFLAGVVLAESEYRHELESDIEPFKGLLLGVFFITVGANINFNIVHDNPTGILKITFLLLLTKFSVLYLVAKIFKLNRQNSLLFSLALAQGGEFCFILISYAVQNQLLNNQMANEMVAVVALSMLITPLLIIVYEKLIEPYFVQSQESNKHVDEIKPSDNDVVIAGFGRFGQIIGRLLLANKIKATILDLDSNNIEMIRKFGLKVFYGDASRLDLLHTAGVEKAKLFIIAIDDSEKALEIAKNVKTHYPHLKILARVRGRLQAYDFFKEGFDDVFRETFYSSLMMGVSALKALGYPAHYALRCAYLFRNHDEANIRHMYKLVGQDQVYINEAKQSRKSLEEAFRTDKEESSLADRAWDIENAKER